MEQFKIANRDGLIFVPDGASIDHALERTSVLCIAAHQDDTEIMAYHAIESCYEKEDRWFTSVIVTDGAGSPRSGAYVKCSDEDMKKIRIKEQNDAAKIGKYGAQIQLGYPSREIKSKSSYATDEIRQIIMCCQPEIIYTHNLADKHQTHVATVLRTIEAIRLLPLDKLPGKLVGLEAWRGLDWVEDSRKLVFDASNRPKLAQALIQVFDSQISGGKSYCQAAMGRRKANATFLSDNRVDKMEYAIYGLDMSELMHSNLPCEIFIQNHIEELKQKVGNNINNLT